MSNALQNGANLSTILTALVTCLLMALGGLWRVAQNLSKHTSRLETLEQATRKAEAEQAEVLKAARENADRLARIETDVRWLRETLGREGRR